MKTPVLDSLLQEQSWVTYYSIKESNSAWIYLKSILTHLFDKHTPQTQKKVKGCYCPWLTPGIKRLMNERNMQLRKARRMNKESDWSVYLKQTPTQVFFCEIWKIFKNTFFEEHLRTTASNIIRSKIFDSLTVFRNSPKTIKTKFIFIYLALKRSPVSSFSVQNVQIICFKSK